MMDEIAMDAAIAVDKGMRVNETERKHRSGDHPIQSLRRTSIKDDHARDKRCQILRSCAEVIGKRAAGQAVMLAYKLVFRPKTELHEALISNHELLQTQKLIER